MSAELLCRFCSSPLQHSFVDLGLSPLSNAYLKPEQLRAGETFYPLHARLCQRCFLVQVDAFETPAAIFSDYAYFSSYSDSWLAHAQRYVDAVVPRLALDERSLVVEVASNDGYLLQYFQARGIPVLGVEPAANVAQEAMRKGIPTEVCFFGTQAAQRLVRAGRSADLVVGNNVLAHVPELNDFVAGLAYLLKPAGTLTLEFPHLLRLMEGNQFDTIYHEHFCYFSLHTAEKVLEAHGLRVFDAEALPTHGGSLRLYACRQEASSAVTAALGAIRREEARAGLDRLDGYLQFAGQAQETKRRLLTFLIEAKRAGKRIAAYGAAAKGNTLLNYCGIRGDFIDYVVDRNPYKQGRYLPGTHIPILAPERVAETRPDFLLILPWNIKDEVMEQMSHIRRWGARFVVPIPQVELY